MDVEKLRAWWFSRQGLGVRDQTLSPQAGLLQSGWARSVAGANPYLTLFSRTGASRVQVDHAVARLDIHELPAARGCTYVVPSEDFGLALALSQPATERGNIATAIRHLGVTNEEITHLGNRILDVLSTTAPIETRQITESVGPAARHLGEEGKKRGTTNTTSLALGRLQSTGQIRRCPVNGRLDQQQYGYVRWENPPTIPTEDIYTELARRYFRWIGPATLANFQWFSGLSAKAARDACAPLNLVPVDFGLLLPQDEAAWHAFRPPTEPQYALVANMDAMLLHRRDLQPLIDQPSIEAKLGSVVELDHHAILDRGRLVGLWLYDPDEMQIVTQLFIPPNEALSAAIAETEAFSQHQLGDVRSFSLDSPASRRPKIAAMWATS